MKKITTLILVLTVSISMFADVSKAEKNALVKLYNATNGNEWTRQWDLNAPVSSWYGVVLENDKVVALNLSKNNLNGYLPAEISKLKYLHDLNLFKNEISGKIPSSLGKLKYLKNF